jgi:hypothetical protein
LSLFQKNKIDGKSAPTSPVLTEDIKKRAERFGDVSQAAKTNTMTVCICLFSFILEFYRVFFQEQKAKRAERFKPITSV